ncbi:MAG: CopG family transcriptional regulator [Terriglobia bacterium]
MDTAHKRATVYFDQKLHRALRLRAAQTDCSISRFVNDAVREALAEDARDLAAIEARRSEPDLDFENVIKEMKKRGRL